MGRRDFIGVELKRRSRAPHGPPDVGGCRAKEKPNNKWQARSHLERAREGFGLRAIVSLRPDCRERRPLITVEVL